ncbi:MAG: hypothetical protein H7A23_11735 [Leptospiraceae bacterium]|nr:hypothetical protein [Leptospiraceae bacterium]MCP5495217.1 hypothetical protein [Leptospiraceae bacterium]
MKLNNKIYIFLIIAISFFFNTCFLKKSNLKNQIKQIKKEFPFQGSCLVKGEVCDEYYGEFSRLKVIQFCTETQSRYSVRYCPKKKVAITCLDSRDYSSVISFYYKDYSGEEGKENFCN